MAIRPTKYLDMPDGNSYEFFGKTYYGVCTSLSSSPIKEVEIDGFVCEPGVRVSILFTNANTYANPKLHVIPGPMKDISFFDETIYNALQVPTYLWSDHQVVDFIYSGNKWIMLNTVPKVWYGVSSSSENVANKTCSIDGFNQACLKEGTTIIIYFKYSNSVTSNLTLQINDFVNPGLAIVSDSGTPFWKNGAHTLILLKDVNNILQWHLVDASSVISVNGRYGVVNLAIPSGNSATPLMDGTGSAGDSIYFSRSNHVHPTDTSRQETLVSGTNIKTIGGESILGSGNIPLPTAISDLTNDAGYVTSSEAASAAPVQSVNGQTGAVTITDSDEKLKTTVLSDTSTTRYVVLGSDSTTAETKQYTTGLGFTNYTNNNGWFFIGKASTQKGSLRLFGGSNAGYTDISPSTSVPSGTSANLALPSSSGTLALTTDIPTPYNSSTNPSGYLRLSDLPIYDGTVTTYAEGVSF